MTFLPASLIGSNDDYIEPLRGYLYPRLHDFLVEYTPAYGVGKVHENQFVGVISADEEVIETELEDAGLVRNPIACLKSTPDGRTSEGSWVLINERDEYDYLNPSRQLHLTLMPREDGGPGLAVYAHNEYDWRDHPLWHLRGKDFKPRKGVRDARRLLNEQTFLTLKHSK